jgi:hypothetical protein
MILNQHIDKYVPIQNVYYQFVYNYLLKKIIIKIIIIAII